MKINENTSFFIDLSLEKCSAVCGGATSTGGTSTTTPGPVIYSSPLIALPANTVSTASTQPEQPKLTGDQILQILRSAQASAPTAGAGAV